MPRYRLDAADMSALVAYLRRSAPDPRRAWATPGSNWRRSSRPMRPRADREAVAAVVERFADVINGGTRQEQRRADASRRHLYGERHVRAFRQLEPVDLDARGRRPSGWPAQLEALYAQRPPFAVISGTAGDDWSVVHEFCERRELPCILPGDRTCHRTRCSTPSTTPPASGSMRASPRRASPQG